jgi:hypothetical protein
MDQTTIPKFFTQIFPLDRCCPLNEIYENGACDCKPGFSRDPDADKCVCPVNEIVSRTGTCECKKDYFRDVTTDRCCRLNEAFNGTDCDCAHGFFRRPDTGYCDCPEHSHLQNRVCVCDEGYFKVSAFGRCCPPNEYFDERDGVCECNPGFLRYGFL